MKDALKQLLLKYRSRDLKALQRFIKTKLKIKLSDRVLKRRIERLDEN